MFTKDFTRLWKLVLFVLSMCVYSDVKASQIEPVATREERLAFAQAVLGYELEGNQKDFFTTFDSLSSKFRFYEQSTGGLFDSVTVLNAELGAVNVLPEGDLKAVAGQFIAEGGTQRQAETIEATFQFQILSLAGASGVTDVLVLEARVGLERVSGVREQFTTHQVVGRINWRDLIPGGALGVITGILHVVCDVVVDPGPAGGFIAASNSFEECASRASLWYDQCITAAKCQAAVCATAVIGALASCIATCAPTAPTGPAFAVCLGACVALRAGPSLVICIIQIVDQVADCRDGLERSIADCKRHFISQP